MQTITKTFNIYDFEELPKETQEQLIKKECEILTENYCEYYLAEDMEEEAKELLKAHFGDKAVFQGVYYSLSYCQGDGAIIEFNLTYYGKTLEIKHDGWHYNHANAFEIISESGKELTEKQYKTLREKIYNINKELEKIGYNFIEDDRTEQAIEQLENCKFYENGDIYEQ